MSYEEGERGMPKISKASGASVATEPVAEVVEAEPVAEVVEAEPVAEVVEPEVTKPSRRKAL